MFGYFKSLRRRTHTLTGLSAAFVLATVPTQSNSQEQNPALSAEDYFASRMESSADFNGVDLNNGTFCEPIHLGSLRPQVEFDLTASICTPIISKNPDHTKMGRILLNGLSSFWRIKTIYGTSEDTVTSISLPSGGGFFKMYRGRRRGAENTDGSSFGVIYNSHGYSNLKGSDGERLVGLKDGIAITGETSTYELFRAYGVYPRPTGLITQITRRNGEIWTVYYQSNTETDDFYYKRPKFIVSSKGLGISLRYLSQNQNSELWYSPKEIRVYNKSEVSCVEELLLRCPELDAIPPATSIAYPGPGEVHIMDGATLRTRISISSAGTLSVSYGDSSDVSKKASLTSGIIGTEAGDLHVRMVNKLVLDGEEWSYDIYSDATPYLGDTKAAYRTDPFGRKTSFTVFSFLGSLHRVRDPLGRVKTFEIDNYFRLGYEYGLAPYGESRTALAIRSDAFGRVYEASFSGREEDAPLIERWSYSDDCKNIQACFQPLSHLDAEKNLTEFEYSERGMLIKSERPPDDSGVRRETRFTYTSAVPWYKTGNGTFEAAPPVWLLMEEEHCKESSSINVISDANGSQGDCSAGPLDEVRTVYEYEQGSPTQGSNLKLIGIAVTAANGAGALQTLRTCYTYDEYGRKISETSPRADLASCS